jgi:hypothetical protein
MDEALNIIHKIVMISKIMVINAAKFIPMINESQFFIYCSLTLYYLNNWLAVRSQYLPKYLSKLSAGNRPSHFQESS